MQTAIVIAIVACAGLWLVWRAVASLRGRKTGCGCAECPAVQKSTARVPRR